MNRCVFGLKCLLMAFGMCLGSCASAEQLSVANYLLKNGTGEYHSVVTGNGTSLEFFKEDDLNGGFAVQSNYCSEKVCYNITIGFYYGSKASFYGVFQYGPTISVEGSAVEGQTFRWAVKYKANVTCGVADHYYGYLCRDIVTTCLYETNSEITDIIAAHDAARRGAQQAVNNASSYLRNNNLAYVY